MQRFNNAIAANRRKLTPDMSYVTVNGTIAYLNIELISATHNAVTTEYSGGVTQKLG